MDAPVRLCVFVSAHRDVRVISTICQADHLICLKERLMHFIANLFKPLKHLNCFTFSLILGFSIIDFHNVRSKRRICGSRKFIQVSPFAAIAAASLSVISVLPLHTLIIFNLLSLILRSF